MPLVLFDMFYFEKATHLALYNRDVIGLSNPSALDHLVYRRLGVQFGSLLDSLIVVNCLGKLVTSLQVDPEGSTGSESRAETLRGLRRNSSFAGKDLTHNTRR